MKDYEIIKYFTMVCGANNKDACTALKLYREVENEKSCAIWKRLIKGIYTPYICDMVVKFCAQKGFQGGFENERSNNNFQR